MKTKMTTMLAAIVMTVTGCGNALNSVALPDAPFTPGAGDNPLNGAVVSQGGVAYTLSAGATMEGIAASNGSAIVFSKENYADLGFPLPVSLITAKGDSVSIDLETGLLSATLNVPFVGPQTFDFPVDLGSLLTGTTAKASAECGSSEASFDAFCMLVDDNAEFAADEGVALALQSAADYGVPEFAFGIIEDTIRQFLDVPVSFCNAWSSVVPRGVCD